MLTKGVQSSSNEERVERDNAGADPQDEEACGKDGRLLALRGALRLGASNIQEAKM